MKLLIIVAITYCVYYIIYVFYVIYVKFHFILSFASLSVICNVYAHTMLHTLLGG